ncbi:MAG: SGNH/GDSL hydrolase family protein [Thermoleophilia bacterium]|nr:SGNH/GDSL hydrolase family protein [Thermoleophilia bacterium]
MSGDSVTTGGRRRIGRYVALGDSFTAGNGVDPGSRWADLVSDALGALNPDFEYFNLARDGATSSEVGEQIPRAIELEPDLITLVCGANDVILELKPDVPAFAARLESILDRLTGALPEAAILTANYPEGWDLTGAGPRTRARIRRGMTELNEAIRTVTAASGVPCLDVVSHPGTGDARNYEIDGLHPSLRGHLHTADEICEVLARDFSIEIPSERRERIWS